MGTQLKMYRMSGNGYSYVRGYENPISNENFVVINNCQVEIYVYIIAYRYVRTIGKIYGRFNPDIIADLSKHLLHQSHSFINL